MNSKISLKFLGAMIIFVTNIIVLNRKVSKQNKKIKELRKSNRNMAIQSVALLDIYIKNTEPRYDHMTAEEKEEFLDIKMELKNAKKNLGLE